MNRSIEQAMDDVTRFHLTMAKVLDSVSSRTNKLEEAQKFYNLSKYESKFYNTSLLAKQAVSKQMSNAYASQLAENSQQAEMVIKQYSSQVTPLKVNTEGATDVNSLGKMLQEGHNRCVATYYSCVNAVTDKKTRLILIELIDQYQCH